MREFVFPEFHHNLYMAAQHKFRFIDWRGDEVIYHPSLCAFREKDINIPDSVGGHIKTGRQIYPGEQLFIHHECYPMFGPKIGDSWINGNNNFVWDIGDSVDLKDFVIDLQREPDAWNLFTRKGFPVIRHERFKE